MAAAIKRLFIVNFYGSCTIVNAIVAIKPAQHFILKKFQITNKYCFAYILSMYLIIYKKSTAANN